MKALVLAAGLGTRLLPYTRYIPKPLFTIGGRSLLDVIICSLKDAGCKAITVNTHHLASQIESFIAAQNYAIPVRTCYEPEILGTGGAIKNIEDFWDDRPFLVVNSDIVTDIDFRSVYDFHLAHANPVTLILTDCPEFNTVSISQEEFVLGFPASSEKTSSGRLTFTGIQVLNREILDRIPQGEFSSSIDLYKQLISEGFRINAFTLNNNFWSDIGTPERYRRTAYDHMVPKAFEKGFSTPIKHAVHRSRIAGDGSDRIWYRIASQKQSLIMVDHGIKTKPGISEADSFVAIGNHLHHRGIPVPEIHYSDPFSGLVFMEDLGDIHLQAAVQKSNDTNQIYDMYRDIIGRLVDMSLLGRIDFDPNWTYQTSVYDKTLILDKECRYFTEAFLNGYMRKNRHYSEFETEFNVLAENAVRFGFSGFMHRDFQSRNIMILDGQFFFIDFQGGRIGPIQYDLASLLIDPYVSLPQSMQNRLLDDCCSLYASKAGVLKDRFIKGYRYCAVTRNLQILGAFGFLSKVKKKQQFAQHIPGALRTLNQNLVYFQEDIFPNLKCLVKELVSA